MVNQSTQLPDGAGTTSKGAVDSKLGDIPPVNQSLSQMQLDKAVSQLVENPMEQEVIDKEVVENKAEEPSDSTYAQPTVPPPLGLKKNADLQPMDMSKSPKTPPATPPAQPVVANLPDDVVQHILEEPNSEVIEEEEAPTSKYKWILMIVGGVGMFVIGLGLAVLILRLM